MKKATTWKTFASETMLETPFVTVMKDQIEVDDVEINDFYTVKIQNAVLIIALTTESQILLKSEFRYACKADVIECPAGMMEEGEEPRVTAERELLEETGYRSDHWTYLGPTLESTSKLTNTMHLFLARDCRKVSEQHLDATEQMELIIVSLDEAVAMVMDGRINANSTAHAILKVNNLLNRSMRNCT